MNHKISLNEPLERNYSHNLLEKKEINCNDMHNLKISNLDMMSSEENQSYRLNSKNQIELSLKNKSSSLDLKKRLQSSQSRTILSRNIIIKLKKDVYNQELIQKSILSKDLNRNINKEKYEKKIVPTDKINVSYDKETDKKYCERQSIILPPINVNKLNEDEINYSQNKEKKKKRIELIQLKKFIAERIAFYKDLTNKKVLKKSYSENNFDNNKRSLLDKNCSLKSRISPLNSEVKKIPFLNPKIPSFLNKNHQKIPGSAIYERIEKEKHNFRINFELLIENIKETEKFEKIELLINPKIIKKKYYNNQLPVKQKKSETDTINYETPLKEKDEKLLVKLQDEKTDDNKKTCKNKLHLKMACKKVKFKKTAKKFDFIEDSADIIKKDELNLNINKKKYYKDFGNAFTDLRPWDTNNQLN